MAFIRISAPKKNGKRYASLEERYRVGNKVKTRFLASLGPVGGKGVSAGMMRKAADEIYRDVLRDNVYRFGTSRPGERYAIEDAARQAFHRYLDSEQRGSPELPQSPEEQMDAIFSKLDGGRGARAEAWDGKIAASNAAGRARAEYDALKDRVQTEDRQLDKDEQNATHAQWSANQAADRDEASADYGDPVSEAEAAAGGPGGGPAGDAE